MDTTATFARERRWYTPNPMPNGEQPGSKLNASEYLTFGGLAVVEGVMMRSPHYYAVACRAPNGQIVVKTEALSETWIGRQKWLKKPFLRGTLALLDTMALGMRATTWAAAVQTDPKHQPEGSEQAAPVSATKTTKAVEGLLFVGTIAFALSFQVLVFRQLPEHFAEEMVRAFTHSHSKNVMPYATNYLAEVIKVLEIILFLALLSRLPSFVELFRYHGAEHKAINTIEAHKELTVDNAAAQTRLHPRCGTNFLIIVAMLNFIIVPAIPRDLLVPNTSPSWMLALSRLPINLVVLPIVAGISYEVIRAAGKAKDQRWVNTLLKPGLATQLITTAEPQPKHLDVAIASLKSVIQAEENGQLTISDNYESPVEDVLS